jgi:hypothetical protein
MNQAVRPPLRRRGSLWVAAIGLGLLAQVLAPQTAFAHPVHYGRCLGGTLGLTTGGAGTIDHSIYHNSVRGSTSAQNNCGPLWSLPHGWVQTNTYVYGNGQPCGSFVSINNGGGPTAASSDTRAWQHICPGAPRPWLTADVQSYVYNPNYGGFWQGGWVSRPTVGHQF